jgi:DNA processing protein
MSQPSHEYRLRRVAFNLLSQRYLHVSRQFKKRGLDARTLFHASPGDLSDIGLPDEAAGVIRHEWQALAEAEIAAAGAHGIALIFREDPEYPPALAQIYDPPDYLYCVGDSAALHKTMLAVVGSRRASRYGQEALQRILPPACRAGVVVVSGMAYGIDSLAHRIALEEGSVTVGVNPGGLLHLYPPGNRTLLARLSRSGAIVSDLPLETLPRPYIFPMRNRIISGLARAVLVVEAAASSGSLITAKLALDQNRDVLAVPGNITSLLSWGTNYLIQQGARAVTCADDLLDELGLALPRERREAWSLSPREARIVERLDECSGGASVDDLVEALGFSTAETITLLMGLVLKNIVCDESGYYKKVSHG